MLDIKRRDLITLIGGAVAWPLAARAQQQAMPVVGFLDATTAADSVYRVSAFREGLKEAGFIDGHNVQIEFCRAESQLVKRPWWISRRPLITVGHISSKSARGSMPPLR
jgi:putative ABC transport system substrate-binding protein